MACKIKLGTGLDSLRAVKDGNVRKRTLRPNRDGFDSANTVA